VVVVGFWISNFVPIYRFFFLLVWIYISPDLLNVDWLNSLLKASDYMKFDFICFLFFLKRICNLFNFLRLGIWSNDRLIRETSIPPSTRGHI
jgi:hypothetical protein